ncbi:MAG: hypothetical protein QOI08_280 [Actinomycetota bacterium]|nr:hypothetical protein [Actinomycetota bacterium]
MGRAIPPRAIECPARRRSSLSRVRERPPFGQCVRVIGDLDDAGEEMQRVITGSLPTKLDLPSPCEGWTVRDVINHVVTGNLRTLAWCHQENGPPNAEDHLRGDPLGAFDDSFVRVRARLAELLTRAVPVRTPFAVLSAERLIYMRCTELTVHAWDIARATGQSTDFLPRLCERLVARARADIESLDRIASPFGAEQPPPSAASQADRLAAFFGRAV